MLDTGATISVIKSSLIPKTCVTHKLKRSLAIAGIGNGAHKALFQVELELFDIKHKFYIVEDDFNISTNVLIGNDLLQALEAKIDFFNNAISIKGETFELTELNYEFDAECFNAKQNDSSAEEFESIKLESSSSGRSEEEDVSSAESEISLSREFETMKLESETDSSSSSSGGDELMRTRKKRRKRKLRVSQLQAYSVLTETKVDTSEEESETDSEIVDIAAMRATKSVKILLPRRSQVVREVYVTSNNEGVIPKIDFGEQISCASCLVQPRNGKAQLLFMNASEQDWEVEIPPFDIEEIESDLEEVSSAKLFKLGSSNRLELLNRKIDLKGLNKEEFKEMQGILEEFSDVFYLDGDEISEESKFKYKIELTDKTPINQKSYKVPFALKKEMDENVQQMRKDKQIRESTSSFNLPVFLVPKKLDHSGKRKYRLIVDLRKLNEKIELDVYPLPLISEILDQLGTAKYFSTVDLHQGFFQLGLDEESSKYTSFSVNGNKYEFTKLPMGLKNSPSFFMRTMNSVLTGLVGNTCFVYLDDIVIYGATLSDHNEGLRKVLKSLQENNLKLQPDKCNFLRKECIFLGHKITSEGVEIDESKVKPIIDFPVPKNVRELRSFLGATGYVRRFIKDYGKVASPLHKLTSSKGSFQWGDREQIAFDQLKRMITNPPVLVYPDFKQQMILTTDASGLGLGAVLSQKRDGVDRPIAYASRALSDVEKKRFKDSATGLELLALEWACKHFRQYLLGVKFLVQTDHKALVGVKHMNNTNPHLMKLKGNLEEFQFDVKYIKGKSNVTADALSRMFLITCLNEEDRKKLIEESHNSLLGGHRGVKPTVQRIKSLGFTWNSIEADVKSHVQKCADCQLAKMSQKTKSKMQITDTPTEPWQKVAIDVVGPLPTTKEGNNYLLTVQDNFSKFLITCPMKTQTAEETAENFVKNVVLKFGIPKVCLTDQGQNFMSKLFKSVKKILAIKSVRTSAFRPQSNGSLERLHRNLKEFLKIFINESQNNWDELTPFAEFVHNSTQSEATGFEPLFLMMGRKVNIPSAFLKESPATPFYGYDDYAKRLSHNLKESFRIARELQVKQKGKRKEIHDEKVNEKEFQLGDQVKLISENVRQGRSKKLGPNWTGPYEIVEKIGEVNFRIKKGSKEKVVHANKLKLFYD
jgi:transposase InsO family protein